MSLTSLPTTRWRLSALLVLAACYSPAYAETETAHSWAVNTSTLEARSQFIKARDALAIADVETFRQIKQSLSNYPLYDYLEYEELAHQFRTEQPSKVSITKLNAFDTQFQNDTLTGQLTRSLQSRLSETEQWSLFLALSQSRVAGKFSCSHLRANYELGNVSTFTDEVLALWVQPKKHHERCQPVLDALQAKQTPPFKAIWERIFLSFEDDKPEFAKPMLVYLSRYERKQVTNWLEALENPEPFLNSPALKKDSQLNRRRFVDLVLAWSKSDPVAAMNHWLENKDRFRFYNDRYYDTHRLLAMRGAYRRLPEAYDWLMGVPARDEDLELKEWRIRAALFDQNWLEVIKNIRRLPANEQEQDHWAYWEARAFDETGHTEKAKTIYAKIAGLQSYHGFLSADRLDQEYAIKNEPLPNDSAQVEALAELPRMIRAREFHHAGVTWEARREWNAALKNADKNTVAAAAQLAMHWNMEDRALATAGRVKDFRSAIDVRFPVLFESLVTTHTTEHSLDPSFVLGLMRRESGFMADAKSPVGATGLMQLMPKTAQHVADMKGKKNWRGDLTDPATNIEFGSYYFRHVLDRFDEREILAAAAYNAGPTRVNSWLPESAMAADVWIDTIPYSETRRYVRALLAYAAIYDVHLTGQPKRLSERLDDIQPKEQDGV